MTSRRKGMRSWVEDDVQHGAPPPRRAKNLANLTTHLMGDGEGTSERSHSSHSSIAKTASDICAICLMPRTDPTSLDKCSHSFCFTCTSQWLKHAETCPLCMTPVSSFSHNIDLPPGLRPVVSVADLREAAEVARLERGRSLPPLNERECVKLRIRRLHRRLRAVQEQMSSTSSRVDHSSEPAIASTRLINEINMLEMLKRDSTTRLELVSNIAFRSLIYKDNLDWSSIDHNANWVPFTPEVFTANEAAATERLFPFVDRELKIVWRGRKLNESLLLYKRKYDSLVSDIISWCSEIQINSPQFALKLRLAGLYPFCLERFQTELFDFASSMLSLEDFDSMSAYSSKELRRLLHRRNRRAASAEEIVLLSEDDSDSAVITTNPDRNDDDVIVLSDDSHSGEESIFSRVEGNNMRTMPMNSVHNASNELLHSAEASLECRDDTISWSSVGEDDRSRDDERNWSRDQPGDFSSSDEDNRSRDDERNWLRIQPGDFSSSDEDGRARDDGRNLLGIQPGDFSSSDEDDRSRDDERSWLRIQPGDFSSSDEDGRSRDGGHNWLRSHSGLFSSDDESD